MTDRNRGNSHRSGRSPAGKKKLAEPAAPESVEGSVNEKLQELSRSVADLQTRIPAPESSLFQDSPTGHPGWGRREETKLDILDHFYRRMVNLQLSCDKDKKKLSKLLEEYRPALKDRCK